MANGRLYPRVANGVVFAGIAFDPGVYEFVLTFDGERTGDLFLVEGEAVMLARKIIEMMSAAREPF
jgi:hypothetical protein